VARWLTVGSVFSLPPESKEDIITASKAMPRNPCFLPNADVKAVVHHGTDRGNFVSIMYKKEDYSDPPSITNFDDPATWGKKRDYYSEDFNLLGKKESKQEAKHVGMTVYGLNMATLSILGRVGVMGSQHMGSEQTNNNNQNKMSALLPRHNCQPRRLNCRNVSSRLDELCPISKDDFKAGMIGTYLGLSGKDSENESRMTIIPLRVSRDGREKKYPKHSLALVAIDSPVDASEDLLGDLFGDLADNKCLRNLFEIVCDKPLEEAFEDTYQEPEKCTGTVEDACKQLDLTYQVLSSFYLRFNGFQTAQDLCNLVVRCFYRRSSSIDRGPPSISLEDLHCFNSWSELSYMATLMLTERDVVFPGVIAGLARLCAAKSAMLGLVPVKTLEQAGNPDSSQERVDEQYLIKAEAPTILVRPILLHVVMPVGKNMELQGSVCDQVEKFSSSEQSKALRDRERSVADFCAHLVEDPIWKIDGNIQEPIWQIDGEDAIESAQSTMMIRDFNDWCLKRRQHCLKKLKEYPDNTILHEFATSQNIDDKWWKRDFTPWKNRHNTSVPMPPRLCYLLFRAATVIGFQEVEGLPLASSPARSYLKLARTNPKLAPGWEKFLSQKKDAGCSQTHQNISLRVRNFRLFIPQEMHKSIQADKQEVTMIQEKGSLPNKEQEEQEKCFNEDQVDPYFPNNGNQIDRCAELQRGVIHTAGMIVAAGLLRTFSKQGDFGGQADLFTELLRSWADSFVHELCTDYGIVVPPPLDMTQDKFPRLSWILSPHIARVGTSADMFCTNLYGWAFFVVFLLEEDKDMSDCEVQYKLDDDYKGVLKNLKVFSQGIKKERLVFRPKAFCKLCPQIVKVVDKADDHSNTSTPITLKDLVDVMVMGGSDPQKLLTYVEARLNSVPICWLVSQFGRFTLTISNLVRTMMDFVPDGTHPETHASSRGLRTPRPEKKISNKKRGKAAPAPSPASSPDKKRTSPRKSGSGKKKKRKKAEEYALSEPEASDLESEDNSPPKPSPRRKQPPPRNKLPPNHKKRKKETNSDQGEDSHLAHEGNTDGVDGGKSDTKKTSNAEKEKDAVNVAFDCSSLRKLLAERAAEKRAWVPCSPHSEATEFQFEWTDPVDFKEDFEGEVLDHLEKMGLSNCEVTLRDVLGKGDCGYYCLLLGLCELEADNGLVAACQSSALPLRKELAYHAFADENGFTGSFEKGVIADLIKNESIRRFVCYIPGVSNEPSNPDETMNEYSKEYPSYRRWLATRIKGLKDRVELKKRISHLTDDKYDSIRITLEKKLKELADKADAHAAQGEEKSSLSTDGLQTFCLLHHPGWMYESDFHREYSEDNMIPSFGPILFASRYKCQVVVYVLINKALKKVHTADGRGSEFIYNEEDVDVSVKVFPFKDPHNRTVYLCYALENNNNTEGAGPTSGHFTYIQRHYHEEHAHLYPITESLPPPPKLLPSNDEIWDGSSRVLKYNTSKPEKQRLSHLYGRNDLTVILPNVFDENELDVESWHLSNILLRHECKYFCEFSVQEFKDGLHREVEKDPSMTPKLFLQYLNAFKAEGTMGKPRICLDHAGYEESQLTVDPEKRLIYMKDVPFQQSAPEMYKDFLKILTFKDSLPGGSFCMLEGVRFFVSRLFVPLVLH
jgi:hypothetical protein